MNNLVRCLAVAACSCSLFLAGGLAASGSWWWLAAVSPAFYLAFREGRHAAALDRIRELERTLDLNAMLGL